MNDSRTEDRPPADPAAGPPPGFAAMPTSEVRLHPSFVQALKNVAPKKRRAVLRYVLLLALLAVVGALAASRSVRETVLAKVRHLVSPGQDAAAATVPPSVAPAMSMSMSTATPTGSGVAAPSAPAATAVAPVVAIPGAGSASAPSSSTKPAKGSAKLPSWRRAGAH